LDLWFGWEFENFNWYYCDANGLWNNSQYGEYGLLHYNQDRDTVRWLTTTEYVTTTPAIIGGYSTNSLVDGRLFTGRGGDWASNPYVLLVDTGIGNYTYAINAPVYGIYSISVSFSNVSYLEYANSTYTMPVFVVDTDSRANITILGNDEDTFQFSAGVNITLKSGMNLVYLTVLEGYRYAWQYIKFSLQQQLTPPTQPPTISPSTTINSVASDGASNNIPLLSLFGILFVVISLLI